MSLSTGRSKQIVWLNGSFIPLDQAAISPLDRGFLYGDGVFETMRAQSGTILYLDDHLERLNRSLGHLKIPAELTLDWHKTLGELISRNGLSTTVSVVKIVVSRGVAPGPGLPAEAAPTVFLSALEYHAPSEAAYRRGWNLEVFREGFSPPLAAHKTLNYLYFCMARQSALDSGANEALILDPAGQVTETSAGSIIAQTAGKWWTPASSYSLSGITLHQVSRLMQEAGKPVEFRQAGLKDILSAETLWILNSLMLVMPVSRVEGRPVPDCRSDEASRLRKKLMER